MSYPTDDAMRKAAARMYEDEGSIEIDEGAPVSRAEGNPSNGAYVQAWVWVDDSDCEDNQE